MHEHLDHVERGIQIPLSESDEIDFAQIFQLDEKAPVTEDRADGRRKKAAQR